jgi:NAD(P)H-hydrate repair Nnr-like enzyme with NAD(P)H-hydrate dehydratase domain
MVLFELELTIVYDADMLWYLTLNKAGPLIKLMRENSIYTILTPNAIEFNRLWQVFIEGKH